MKRFTACTRMNAFRKIFPVFSGFRCLISESLRNASTATASSEKITALHSARGSMQTLDDPLKHEDFFAVHNLFTVRDLFDARVHFGHKEGTLNQHMLPYVFGSRLGVTIIDLNQTAARLKEALNFIAHISYRNGIILFVSSCRQTSNIVEKTAEECGQYSHCRKFDADCFLNSTEHFGAITRLPDLVVLLKTHNNVFEEHEAVRAAAQVLIPTVAIVDTNSNPCLITYPIPGNDDTPSAIQLYCKLFKEAVLLGKRKREEMLQTFGTVVM